MRGFSIVGALAISIAAARNLGPTEFGIYSLAISVVTLISLPTQAGLPTLLMRETAKYYSQNEISSINGLWGWGREKLISLSIIALLVSLAGHQIFSWKSEGVIYEQFLLSLPLIFLIPAANCRSAMIRGLQHPLYGQIPETVIRPIAFIILIYSCAFTGSNINSSKAVLLFCISSLLAYLVGIAILKRVKPSGMRRSIASRNDSRAWKKALLPLALIDSLQIISSHVLVVLSGMILDEEKAGLLRVATSIASTTTIGLQAISMVVAPLIASLYYKGQIKSLSELSGRIAIIGTITSIPITLTYSIFGEKILSTIYGSDYAAAAPILIIISASYTITSAFGVGATVLNMSGNEKESAKALAISVIANITLAIPLMYAFSLTGAAISLLISMAIFSLLAWRCTIKKTGIDIGPFTETIKLLRGGH